MSSSKKTKKIALLSLLLAIAILLNAVENIIPVIIPVPGVKLGLANTMGLIVLYFFSRKHYILIGFLRVIIVSILFNGLFSSGFYLSLSGWLLSSLICLLLSFCKHVSIYALSVSSSIFHGIGQIIMACVLYSSIYMLSYLPILLLSGLISGLVIAFLSSIIITRISKIIKKIN